MWFFALLALGLLTVLAWQLLPAAAPGQDPGAAVMLTPDPSSTGIAAVLPTDVPPATDAPPVPTPTPSITPEPSAIPTETVTPTATSTPLPTPGPGFETPFGPEQGFLIHVVAPGESFTSIAANFGTTPEVLQTINPSIEGVSLWAGRQLVVPIGVQEVGDLPVFVIVFTTETVNVLELADFYGSDAEQIRFFNQLSNEALIPAGRWLIVPVIDT